VPAIVQWKRVVPARSAAPQFLLTTDLFPTLAQAGGAQMPPSARVDGVSFLPLLLGNKNYIAFEISATDRLILNLLLLLR
jgi:arylsulfatase A-like enzyme